MKLRHFAVFGRIFTVIICLLLFLFIVTADDEESGSSSLDFSGLNLSAEVLKHQPTVEKYAKEYGISDYVNYLLAIMQVESGGTGTTDVMQASESLGLPLNLGCIRISPPLICTRYMRKKSLSSVLLIPTR